jgi:hypothetical protein
MSKNGNNTMIFIALGVGAALLSSSVSGAIYMNGGSLSMGQSSSPEQTMPVSDEETSSAVSGLDGAKLITVGDNSMVVEGSSCSQGKVVFSTQDGAKWVWRLHRIGEYNSKDVYSIESDYKNFNQACDERWLTAPSGCNGPPYLAKRSAGPTQSWMIYQSGGGFQIRNLSCVRARRSNTYLMVSGSKEGQVKPSFSSGGGSTFNLEDPSTTDVL